MLVLVADASLYLKTDGAPVADYTVQGKESFVSR